MIYDLQKASMWKRIAAAMFDWILVAVLAVGAALLLSMALGYDSYSVAVNDSYTKYEEEYGISFDITEEEYLKLTDEQKKLYDEAQKALLSDEDAIYAYNMVVSLTMLIVTLSILLSVMLLLFAVPLLFGNGQTLGKKIFALGLVKPNCVRINSIQLLIRALLGSYTIETMIPVYIVIMLLFGAIDVTGTIILLALLAAEVIIMAATKTNSLIHDLLAGTVAVELSSQMVFESEAELIEYKKRLAAEAAAKKAY